MERSLILETTFLVDLERERSKGRNGTARAFLERHAAYRLFITGVIAGELAAGISLAKYEVWEDSYGPSAFCRSRWKRAENTEPLIVIYSSRVC